MGETYKLVMVDGKLFYKICSYCIKITSKTGGVATEDSYFPSVLCSIPISECLVARALVMVQRLFDSHSSCRLNTEFWLGQMNFGLFCLITENNLMVLKQCVFDMILLHKELILC